MRLSQKWIDRHAAMADPPRPKKYVRYAAESAFFPITEKDPPLPDGTFSVIYADPPWRYDHGDVVEGGVEEKYPTMALEDICAFGAKLKPHIADHSILFLWATVARLPDSLHVMEAWGFRYLTNMIWDKKQLGGIGYYLMGRHELLLIGKHGNPPPPLPKDRPESIFVEQKRGHSRKPLVAYDLIERMYPHGKYLELYSRNERPGWTMWGTGSGLDR